MEDVEELTQMKIVGEEGYRRIKEGGRYMGRIDGKGDCKPVVQVHP